MKREQLLTYALNESGVLVHIDEVENGRRCGCYCPECKTPLIARNRGEKRVAHFAHEAKFDCPSAVETMLHILAKKKTREAFLDSRRDQFLLKFDYNSFCVDFKTCKFRPDRDCFSKATKMVNLKDYYDTCEEEQRYTNGVWIADLKFSSKLKPQRKPLYIEFWVSHKSEKEKLNCGEKIIEIKIESEEDIDRLVKNGICVSHQEEYEEIITFWGFETDEYLNQSIERDITRYRYYESGKLRRAYPQSCKSRDKEGALFEVWVFSKHYMLDLYSMIYSYAFQKTRIQNCNVCRNFIKKTDIYGDMKLWCRYYQYLGLPKGENIDTSRARSCPRFLVDWSQINDSIKELNQNVKFKII